MHGDNVEGNQMVSVPAIQRNSRFGAWEGIHVECSYKYDTQEIEHFASAAGFSLPNHIHCEYTVRAAEAGIHVLCEKPMAVTEEECLKMITAAEQVDVRLMIAYRLHFEKSNLKAIELVQSGTLGEPRIFESVFTQQVKPGDT